MNKFARTDFYRGISEITREFMEKDFDMLQNQLQERHGEASVV